MLKKGTIVGGRPWRPMSEATVKGKTKAIRYVMVDLSYLTRGGKPKPGSRIRDLKVSELIDWMKSHYPDEGYSDPFGWKYHGTACIKLAEFLYFEVKDRKGRRAFSKKDVDLIKSEIKIRAGEEKERSHVPTLTEDFIDRLERFLEWMKGEDPFIYAFAAWSYYTTMRYDEVRRMDVGLESGSSTLRYDGVLMVDGKRDRGKKRVREVPVGEAAQGVLDWWLAYREEHGIDCEALFPAEQRLERRGKYSNTLNRRLRLLAKASGLFKGDCDKKGDKPTGELELFRSHVLGRHAGATALAHGGAELHDIKRQTGHKDLRILDERYINVDSKSVSRRLDAVRRNGNGGGGENLVKVDVKDLFRQLLELPKDDREQLALMLLRGDGA